MQAEVYRGMKAGMEGDSRTVRSGISGAYCRKVKMFDDGWGTHEAAVLFQSYLHHGKTTV
jgi:hypothetical protein